MLKFPNNTFEFNGADYVGKFVLPNVYFHITTAYGILRNRGVALGKPDYLGGAKGIKYRRTALKCNSGVRFRGTRGFTMTNS